MRKKYYYHFTFEKYYNEMLESGFILPGKHRNYLPYDAETGIGEVEDDARYSEYIYLAKSMKTIINYVVFIEEQGLDFLNKQLFLRQISEKEYFKLLDDLGDIIVLKIPAENINKEFLVDDFNNIKRNMTFAYPLKISLKNTQIIYR